MKMMVFFFFKQKTAYEIRKGDWSSDVCSSDLERMLQENPLLERAEAEEEAARAEEFPLAGPGRVTESAERIPSDTSDGNAPEARGAHDDAPDPADFTDYSSGSSDGDWGGGSTSEDDDFY